MPSHLKRDDVRPEGVSELDVTGNSLPDFYAGEIAREYQVPEEVANMIINRDKETSLIQNRIATIIMSLPPRQRYKTVCTPKQEQQTLKDIIDASPLKLVQEGNRYHCMNCNNSFLCNDPSFRHWLVTPCVSLPSCSRPIPLDNNRLHIGNQFVNYSHKLAIQTGLVYCRRCGSRKGKDHVKKLARACHPPTSAGRASLLALSLGKLPQGLDSWPEDD